MVSVQQEPTATTTDQRGKKQPQRGRDDHKSSAPAATSTSKVDRFAGKMYSDDVRQTSNPTTTQSKQGQSMLTSTGF